MVYTKLGEAISSHTTLDSIAQALGAGAVLVDQGGTPLPVVEFMGGILAGPSALPLNVLLDGVWNPGQKEALQPFWDSGQLPRPSTEIVNMPTAAPATSLLPLLAGAAVVFLLLRGK